MKNFKEIVNSNEYLKNEYNSLVDEYKNGSLDYDIGFGRFFNYVEDESKVVIQYWTKSETTEDDIEYNVEEIIVDSLEELVVTLDMLYKKYSY